MIEQMPEEITIEREEDLGASFRAPLYSRTIMIPECNVCTSWIKFGKCKKHGDSPIEFRDGKSHDCPDAVLDTKKFNYRQYNELYPEECKRSKLK